MTPELRPRRVASELTPSITIRKPMTVTISGSYQRHLDQVDEAIRLFTDLGARILSPPSGEAEQKRRGFTKLKGDPSETPMLTEHRHLDAISRSHLLWLVVPDGKIGRSTSLELGFAFASHVPAFSMHKVADATLRLFVRQVSGPAAALQAVRSRNILTDATLLLDPSQVIASMRGHLEELETLLHWEGSPMSIVDSARAVQIASTLRAMLNGLGTIAD
jgi:hypothetical protein